MAKKKKKEDFNRPGKTAYQTIIKPLITEKSASAGVAVFQVAKTSTKTDIKEAIESIFKVEVDAVRTCNYLGKERRVNRSIGKQAGYKKAYISLKEGYTIDLVEGI